MFFIIAATKELERIAAAGSEDEESLQDLTAALEEAEKILEEMKNNNQVIEEATAQREIN